MRKVLFVDDNKNILESFGLYLTKQGFEVKLAESAANALETLENFTPDVIISDMRMPDMDGVEFIKNLPKREGFFPGKIIFTAFDDHEAMELSKLDRDGVIRVEKDRWEVDLDSAIARALELNELYLKAWEQGRKNAALQAEKKAEELKSVFIASISHELLTPMTSIIGFTENVLRKLKKGAPLRKDYEKPLQNILAGANTLMSLINNILEVVFLERGVRLNVRDVSLPLLADDIRKEFTGLIGNMQKSFKLSVHFPEDVKTIKADQTRLLQILRQLVNNAIKFSESGSIDITAFNVDDEVAISVKDSGVGIAEPRMKDIFDRFSQIDRSGAKPGTGLGLYICKKLVELHGGKIWAESKPGKGSTFYFTLPAKDPYLEKKEELNVT